MALNCLIIEDEPFARKELKRLMKAVIDEFEIVDELDSVEDSLAFFQSNNKKPDLIFCDIQLSDGLSFEVFQQVVVEVPIVFTTAYNEFAIKAFEQNSIAYLLKPIEEEDLSRAMNKFFKWQKQSEPNKKQPIGLTSSQLMALDQLTKPKVKTRFIAKVGAQIKMIPTKDIAYFFAEDKVVFLVRKDGKKFIVDYNLEQINDLVSSTRFFRINRGFIITFDSIKEVHKYFNSRLKLEIDPRPADDVMVSRNRVSDFMNWLDQ